MIVSPLIHIGYHKTASTLLQERLFCQSSLGFQLPRMGRSSIHKCFISPLGFEEPSQELIDELQRESRECNNNAKTLVISHERLSGYPANGGFDQVLIARRLHKAFPKAKILIFIREQSQMLLSMYLQSISDGSTLSFNRFFQNPEPDILRRPTFRMEYYQYHLLLNYYVRLFGRKNIKVIAYEQIESDPESVIWNILTFVNQSSAVREVQFDIFRDDINKSRPILYQEIRRHINKLFRNQLNENGVFEVENMIVEYVAAKVAPAFAPLSVFDPILRKRLQRKVNYLCMEQFSKSNFEVSELMGLDLSTFGYQV